MSNDQRNDGLHPQHPGRGKCGVIELESDAGRVEDGGFVIFLPSGATKVIAWRIAKPITPTLEAAKAYATEVVDSILKAEGISSQDIQRVNWTSVAAAIQRVIIDFNTKLVGAINAKMISDFAQGKVLH